MDNESREKWMDRRPKNRLLADQQARARARAAGESLGFIIHSYGPPFRGYS
jgi:hypothetical protein